MKEAFWGILIVSLGLLGVVIVNVFQRITTGNDQTYYLLKETAEAASYEAIDLQYYRLNGDLRIVEEKFVENFTRRWAENVSALTDYNIKVEAINEIPPRISVSVRTSVTSLGGDALGINNRIDGVLETKYGIKEVTDFLDITEEEWVNRENQNKSSEANACKITTYGSEERECISGDVEFSRWEDLTIPKNICDDGTYGKETRKAYYKVCECGVWKEEEQEVEDTPTKTGIEYVYDWKLHVDGEIRDIDEIETTRHYIDKCTIGVQIYKPKDLRITEPSGDNSEYELCSGGNTTVNEGQTIVLHANYLPNDATNRIVKWTSNNDKALSLQYSNPLTENGYSRASITGLKAGEETIITATTTNGHTATCKVKVLDGYADNVSCEDKTIDVGSNGLMIGHYLPYTATKTVYEWSSGDTSVGTINGSSGVVTGIKAGTSTITIKSKNPVDNTEISNTCTLTVKSTGGSSTSTGGGCTCTRNEFIKIDKVKKCAEELCKNSTKYGLMCHCIRYEWVDVNVYDDVTRSGTKIVYVSKVETSPGNFSCFKTSYCKNAIYSCDYTTSSYSC